MPPKTTNGLHSIRAQANSARNTKLLALLNSPFSRAIIIFGLTSCIIIGSQIHHLAITSLHCSSSSHSPLSAADATLSIQINNNPCQLEYDRISAKQTPGLTKHDFLRSRAWLGNQYRLTQLMKSLSSRTRPVVGVVAGGSISLGHGVTPETLRYANRLESWMNEMYPLQNNATTNQHKVINVAAHGADMCAMAKRLNILYSDLESQMPASSSNEPDLVVLEFAVNDYQGQDHLITVDHKTSVFFDGFRELVLCAEVVVHSLLTKYPNAAIMFVEMQTAVLTRKTGALLHMGVAQQYQIPVISYAETMYPDFYQLIHLLERMDDTSYSFNHNQWKMDGGVDLSDIEGNTSQYAFAVLPFPHGCSPCQAQHIIPQFRQGGCKSICTFVERSGIIHNKKLKCNAKQGQIPAGRDECFVPFLAHDAVHPSALGHAIIKDLIVDTLASSQQRVCQGDSAPDQDVLPLTTFVAESFDELKIRGDFLWVHDVARIFSRWDDLKPIKGGTTEGFTRYADDDLKQRPGWIATNEAGGEKITFPIDLPPNECYVVYVAILRSYKGMGTMQVEVRGYGDKDKDKSVVKHTTTKDVDGLWESPISVWSDVQLTEDNTAGCTGYCEVSITTNPTVEGRVGNKVKILTVSARRCSALNSKR
eukprot:scaffold202_cov202-Alexandrium_tamarense.AAC.3